MACWSRLLAFERALHLFSTRLFRLSLWREDTRLKILARAMSVNNIGGHGRQSQTPLTFIFAATIQQERTTTPTTRSNEEILVTFNEATASAEGAEKEIILGGELYFLV